MLGPHGRTGFSPVAVSTGLLFPAVHGLPVAAPSAQALECGSQGARAQVRCSEARGVFLHQGSNLCLLHWQADSLPLSHQAEKARAPHSSTLAWKIPWAEEPARLQSTGSLGVGHDWATSLSLSTFMPWRRKWQPTPVFLPGESQGRGSLVGCCLWGRTTEAT